MVPQSLPLTVIQGGPDDWPPQHRLLPFDAQRCYRAAQQGTRIASEEIRRSLIEVRELLLHVHGNHQILKLFQQRGAKSQALFCALTLSDLLTQFRVHP